MPKQDPLVRARNFNEVAHGYTPDMATQEARRCLVCKKPLCIQGCPVGINIPLFVKHVGEGNFKEAIRTLKDKNLLPAICGRVCPQEEQCEVKCVLHKKGGPIAIGRIERFAADWEAMEGIMEVPEIKVSSGKRVAVVGAGPSGLTAAADLAKLGHKVTMFEALNDAGGVLSYGIPEFRLPKAIVKREVEFIKKLGVDLLLDFVIGKTLTVDDLFADFNAVYIGTGAGLPWFMNIDGENLNGMYSANEYLTRVNLMKAYLFPEYDTPIKIGKHVAVIGGGNVAMDAARTALRLGADDVRIVYRRSRQEMPARLEEIENAEEEGIIFEYLTLPVKYIGDSHYWLQEMECLRMELGEPDKSGRRRPIPIKGSEFRIPVDVAVCAIGQSPNPLIPSTTPGLNIGKDGNIIIDPATGKTSKKGVFAGGDVATGAATVILAMGAGRVASRTIDEYLKTGAW